jgi:hypothetical protein
MCFLFGKHLPADKLQVILFFLCLPTQEYLMAERVYLAGR